MQVTIGSRTYNITTSLLRGSVFWFAGGFLIGKSEISISDLPALFTQWSSLAGMILTALGAGWSAGAWATTPVNTAEMKEAVKAK